MRSLGSIMEKNRGIGPGFDFLRLALALSVVFWHSRQVSYGREPVWLAVYLIVPAFFALSGFLVAGSMVRVKTVKVFLMLRILRIVPALGVEITLSALILGPLVTALTLSSYFSDPLFVRYFTNVLGIIRYQLPGVFIDNPVSGIVNGQLWTVPSELHCYVVLAVLMVTRIAIKPWLMLGAFLGLATAESLTVLLPDHHYTMSVLNSHEVLILSFLCGNVFYLWRDRIPWNRGLFVCSIAGYFVVGYLAPALSFLVGVIAVCYFIVFLGMCQFPRVPVLMRGDYSYGIYLYGYPLQQAVSWAFPELREWYFNLLVAGPLAIAFSMLSWHSIEKPALGLKRFLVPRPAGPPHPASSLSGAVSPASETRLPSDEVRPAQVCGTAPTAAPNHTSVASAHALPSPSSQPAAL